MSLSSSEEGRVRPAIRAYDLADTLRQVNTKCLVEVSRRNGLNTRRASRNEIVSALAESLVDNGVVSNSHLTVPVPGGASMPSTPRRRLRFSQETAVVFFSDRKTSVSIAEEKVYPEAVSDTPSKRCMPKQKSFLSKLFGYITDY